MEVERDHESPRKPSVGVITIQSPLGIPSRTTGKQIHPSLIAHTCYVHNSDKSWKLAYCLKGDAHFIRMMRPLVMISPPPPMPSL